MTALASSMPDIALDRDGARIVADDGDHQHAVAAADRARVGRRSRRSPRGRKSAAPTAAHEPQRARHQPAETVSIMTVHGRIKPGSRARVTFSVRAGVVIPISCDAWPRRRLTIHRVKGQAGSQDTDLMMRSSLSLAQGSAGGRAPGSSRLRAGRGRRRHRAATSAGGQSGSGAGTAAAAPRRPAPAAPPATGDAGTSGAADHRRRARAAAAALAAAVRRPERRGAAAARGTGAAGSATGGAAAGRGGTDRRGWTRRHHAAPRARADGAAPRERGIAGGAGGQQSCPGTVLRRGRVAAAAARADRKPGRARSGGARRQQHDLSVRDRPHRQDVDEPDQLGERLEPDQPAAGVGGAERPRRDQPVGARHRRTSAGCTTSITRPRRSAATSRASATRRRRTSPPAAGPIRGR